MLRRGLGHIVYHVSKFRKHTHTHTHTYRYINYIYIYIYIYIYMTAGVAYIECHDRRSRIH